MPVHGLNKEEHGEKLVGWNEEPPLIDFDEPAEKHLTQVEKPADRLKMLLRQMEAEVEETKIKQAAVRAVSPVKDVKSNWRDGRRGVLEQQQARRRYSSQEENVEPGSEADGEEDSPPTPPLRITNPYLSRRTVERGPHIFLQC